MNNWAPNQELKGRFSRVITRPRMLVATQHTPFKGTNMSDNDSQPPNSEKPVVSGRLRVEPWDARISSHPQLKLFCDLDALHFISPSSHPKPPRAETRNNRSDNSSYMNDFVRDLISFCEFGRRTQVLETIAATFGGEPLGVRTYANEFWTAKQR